MDLERARARAREVRDTYPPGVGEQALLPLDNRIDELERGLAKAHTDRDRFEAAIRRVRAVHFRGETSGCCIECSRLIPGPGVQYPCPTIRVLDGEEA